MRPLLHHRGPSGRWTRLCQNGYVEKYAVVIHEDPEGGFWAEVPALAGLLFARRVGFRVDGQRARGDRGCIGCEERPGPAARIEHPDSRCSRRRPITGLEVWRLLEANGWKLQRIRGSHHVYAKASEPRILSIPVHGNRNLKPGPASRIAGDADIGW